MTRNYVQVIGFIWMPNDGMCAMEIPLRRSDIANMMCAGEFHVSREGIEDWLSTHAGDFSHIEDFSAWINGEQIPWEHEESEFTYHDCLYGEESP